MLYDAIKNVVKGYLIKTAKSTEELCKNYDTAKAKSEVQASITALEALLKNAKLEQTKKPIQESVNKLKAEDQQIATTDLPKSIEAFAICEHGELTCVISLSKEALKYRSGAELQSSIASFAKKHGIHVKQTDTAMLLEVPYAASQKKDFFDDLAALENPAICFQNISIYDIVKSAAKEQAAVKKADTMIAGIMDNVLTAVKTTKRAHSIEEHVESAIDQAVEGDRGYFTIKELIDVLKKSRVCVQNHIRGGLLQATTAKIPGKKGKLIVVPYDSVIEYKNKYYHKTMPRASLVQADIAAKHSDKYIMAVHNINEKDLDYLKGQKKGKAKKAKAEKKPEQNGDEIKQFFREHGVGAKALSKAKDKFGLDGRILHGHRMAVMHEKK